MRKYFNWGQWDAINSELGIKPKKKALPARLTDPEKKRTKIEKFCKCKECGGQMTYIEGTNSLICDCEVERVKQKIIRNKLGEVIGKESYKVKEPCGCVNLVSDEFMGYVEYLFN